MTLTLRHRIVLTLLPLLLLIAVIGSAGVVLLQQLGNSVNAILRENYDSVIAMERLSEALERIDSSFQFAMSGQQERARRQYIENWEHYQKNLDLERNNITLQGEAELVDQVEKLSAEYRRKGDKFHEPREGARDQEGNYYGPSGLLETFNQIKDASGQIRQINQHNMEEASRKAKRLAEQSLIWFGIGLVVAAVLGCFAAWRTVRTVLHPIQSMTQAAVGISSGNLDQLVPYSSKDELGELAQAFNSMTRNLREFRQAQSSQLRRVQQATQATVDSFVDPVIVVDNDGFVDVANPAARRLLGVLPKQSGQAVSSGWQPPEPLRQPLTDALTGRSDYIPDGFDHVILLGSNGRERAMLPRILTIRDTTGHTLGAAVLLQDVTRLRLLDQVKSDLVATVSHELKTPLTSIRLAVHLLLEENVGPLTPKQLELLLDARENSERLLAMINNLLDLARLEQGARQLNIQPERPESLLRASADIIRTRAEDQGVEISLEIPPSLPQIAVDAARLSSALQNLLDNALTYTNRGGRITLGATPEKSTVTLSIADTGVGISAEHLPHVFDKFFRVPGQSRGRGTGLGLAIVQEIVTAQGGTISCESAPDRGTTFLIKLPIAVEQAEAVSAGSFADKEQQRVS